MEIRIITKKKLKIELEDLNKSTCEMVFENEQGVCTVGRLTIEDLCTLINSLRLIKDCMEEKRIDS